MSYSQLIHEYLDEGLDGTRQDVLFARLANDPELRQDFSQQVKIHGAAQSDMRTITPPVDSTNAIFSALGFAIPSTDYKSPDGIAVPDLGMPARLVSFWKKHIPTVLAIFITATVTSLFFMSGNSSIINNRNGAGKINDIPIVTASAIKSEVVQQNKAAGLNENAGLSKQAMRTIRHPHLPLAAASKETNTRNSSISDNNSTLAENAIVSNNYTDASESNHARAIDMSGYTPALVPVNYSDLTGPFIPNELALNQRSLNIARQSDWQLILRHYSGNSVNDVAVPIGNASALNNWSITIQRKLADNISLGAEFGQDAFAQRFSSMVGGESINYRQKPSSYWLGGVISYNHNLAMMGSLGEYLTPFAKLFIGGAQLGFMLRPQAGISCDVFRSFNISVGYEAAYLWYNVQSSTYRTDKYGLTFGAGYNF